MSGDELLPIVLIVIHSGDNELTVPIRGRRHCWSNHVNLVLCVVFDVGSVMVTRFGHNKTPLQI